MRRHPPTATLLAALALLAPHGQGQSASHAFSVGTPEYIGLRIVGAGTGPRSVTFDYASNPTDYLSAIDGAGVLSPTAVNRFDDVELSISRNGRWRIHVEATAFTYSGPTTPAGLALSDIRVTRTRPQDAVAGPGNSATYAASWTLSTAPLEIATSNRTTGGWRSLGFSGWDYTLLVNGDEAAGDYSTVVTYSLTSP